jgi:molecular chaperone GrpE
MASTKPRKRKEESLEKLQTKVIELEENWKRALADYRNLEKRISQQQETFVRLASAALVDKLLGVLDDLERAAGHISDEGLDLVLTQFKSVLESEGVKEIKTEREEFDPETMDCVEMVDGPKNMVTRTTVKGYRLNSNVIRPAKVEVGKGENNPGAGSKRRKSWRRREKSA